MNVGVDDGISGSTRLLDDGSMAAWWTMAAEEGGAITSYGAGCAQFVGRRRRGGSTLNCTALVSQLCSLPPLRCSVVQSLNHRKLAGLLKREEGHWAASGRPGVGIRGLGKGGEGE